jgi:hypothetical protein
MHMIGKSLVNSLPPNCQQMLARPRAADMHIYAFLKMRSLKILPEAAFTWSLLSLSLSLPQPMVGICAPSIASPDGLSSDRPTDRPTDLTD